MDVGDLRFSRLWRVKSRSSGLWHSEGWRWRQQCPLKRWHPTTSLHGNLLRRNYFDMFIHFASSKHQFGWKKFKK